MGNKHGIRLSINSTGTNKALERFATFFQTFLEYLYIQHAMAFRYNARFIG